MTHHEAWIRVAALEELKTQGMRVIQGLDRPVVVCVHEGIVSALDNRCPHLGFPLSKGTLKDGILTCHWHQARFDLCSGSTFDLWADDAPAYDTRVVDGVVFVASHPRRNPDAAYHLRRLHKGMEQNIGLLQAKSLIGLLKGGAPVLQIVREILNYAVQSLNAPTGITELAIAGTLHPVLGTETTYLLLLRAAQQIAQASKDSKRQQREALGGSTYSFETLKHWFYEWVRGRDREGAERVLLTAIEIGLPRAQLAEMLFGAVSERVYCDQGHVFDFINKQFELLDFAGWEHAAQLLPLCLPQLVSARGAEEDGTWHHPIEIIEPLRDAERNLPETLRNGAGKTWSEDSRLAETLSGDDPLKIITVLQDALLNGAAPCELAKRVCYAGALRLARFAKANDVGDWFNPQHTYTYANAVYHAVKRTQSPDVVRAIFHAALSVYMDRFLNVPPAKLPFAVGETRGLDELPSDPKALKESLLQVLNEQARLDEAAKKIARYLRLGHPLEPLFDTLTYATIREDLDFHTLQVLEAGYQQYREWRGGVQGEHILVGVVRDLAAVCPTPRARLKTATTALRLHHGDRLYEEEA